MSRALHLLMRAVAAVTPPSPGNTPPVAVDNAYSTPFETQLVVNAPGVLGNDTDADLDTLTAGSASDPAHGSVSLSADGSFTYTPDTGWSGADTFTYVVSDGQGGTDTGTVTVTTGAAAGDMPTALNTGPSVEPVLTIDAASAIAAGGASNRIITDAVSHYLALGEVQEFTDCVFQQGVGFDVEGSPNDFGLVDYPHLTFTRCRFDSSFVVVNATYMTMDACNLTTGAGMIAPCPTCAGFEDYGLERQMPWVVTNTWFRALQGTFPEHTEGAHIAGNGQGYSFINCRFCVRGPENGTQTGALFFHGGGATYSGCWFDSDDTGNGASGPTYYTVYSYGSGAGINANVFDGCHVQQWIAAYFYPVTAEDPAWGIATVTNCVDFDTGDPIDQPTALVPFGVPQVDEAGRERALQAREAGRRRMMEAVEWMRSNQ